MECTTASPGMHARITYEDIQRRKRLEMSKSFSASESLSVTSRAKTERITLNTEQQLPEEASEKSIISSRIAVLIDPRSLRLGRNHVAALYRTLLALKQLHYKSSNTDFGDFYPPEQKINLNAPSQFESSEDVLVSKIVNLIDETLNSSEERGVTTAISSLVRYAQEMTTQFGFRRGENLDIYIKVCFAACKTLARRVRGKGNLFEDWSDSKLAVLLSKHLAGRKTRMMDEQLRIRYFRKYAHLAEIEPLPLTAEVLRKAFPQRYCGPAIVFLQLLCEASENIFEMAFITFCDEVRFE